MLGDFGLKLHKENPRNKLNIDVFKNISYEMNDLLILRQKISFEKLSHEYIQYVVLMSLNEI